MNDDVDEDPTGNKALWDRGLLNGASQKAEVVANFHVGETVNTLEVPYFLSTLAVHCASMKIEEKVWSLIVMLFPLGEQCLYLQTICPQTNMWSCNFLLSEKAMIKFMDCG